MIVYKATNIVNGKVYIGQTVTTLSDRRSKHSYEAFRKGLKDHFHSAIRKYGMDSFKWEILQECNSIDELNQSEVFHIARHGSQKRELGYNLRSGGKNDHLSEETKRKISIANTGKVGGMLGKKHSSETRKKMSKPKSKEHAENISKAKMGIPVSDDHRRAMSLSRIGRRLTESHKRSLSLSLSGSKNPFYGKRHSVETIEKIRQKKTGSIMTQETRKKMSLSHVGRRKSDEHRKKISEYQRKHNGRSVLMVDKETDSVLMIFECINDAVRHVNQKSNGSILRVCQGQRHSAHGYKWRYAK